MINKFVRLALAKYVEENEPGPCADRRVCHSSGKFMKKEWGLLTDYNCCVCLRGDNSTLETCTSGVTLRPT